MERGLFYPQTRKLSAPKRLRGKYVRSSKYEFSWDTKQEAMRRNDWRCFVTKERGTPDEKIQIHHFLPIGVWFYYFRDQIPVSVLTSVENAVPLKASIHKRLHDEATMSHWVQVANFLLATHDSLKDKRP